MAPEWGSKAESVQKTNAIVSHGRIWAVFGENAEGWRPERWPASRGAPTISELISSATERNGPRVNLRRSVRPLDKRWLLIGALALAGVGVAGGYLATQAPEYRSTARTFVAVESRSLLYWSKGGPALKGALISSYAEVATSPRVLDPVITDLGLDESAAHLADRVQAEGLSDTALIEITATDPSPLMAASIANDVSRRLDRAVASLAPTGSTPVKLTQVAAATPPTSPTYRNALATLVLGLLAGTGVGTLIVAVRDRLGGGGGVRSSPGPLLT